MLLLLKEKDLLKRKNFKEMNTINLMKKIKQDPYTYLGEISIYRLKSFMDGYVEAISKFKRDDKLEDLDYMKFNDWIFRKFNISNQNLSWISVINLEASNDLEAFEKIFLLLDEFSTKYGKLSFTTIDANKFTISDLSELLLDIKKRPALFLGIASLSLLYVFLSGYKYARKEFNLPISSEEQHLEGFQNWLPLRLNINTTCSWDRVIITFCRDEKKALELFFEFYSEYLKEKECSFNKYS